jgi:hypothetical protein
MISFDICKSNLKQRLANLSKLYKDIYIVVSSSRCSAFQVTKPINLKSAGQPIMLQQMWKF